MFRLLPMMCISFLASCSAYVPSNTEDACQIFEGNIDWYRDVKISEKRWGMPAHIIMAFVCGSADRTTDRKNPYSASYKASSSFPRLSAR